MLKIKLNKKVNPQKSNKMIYAVAAGLAVVLIVFFALTIGSGGAGKLPADALAYLKNTDGLVALEIVDAEKKALIVYSSDSKNAGNFEQIAHFAAIRLSRTWPDCRVLLAKNSAAQVVYEVRVKNGVVAGEGPVTPGAEKP